MASVTTLPLGVPTAAASVSGSDPHEFHVPNLPLNAATRTILRSSLTRRMPTIARSEIPERRWAVSSFAASYGWQAILREASHAKGCQAGRAHSPTQRMSTEPRGSFGRAKVDHSEVARYPRCSTIGVTTAVPFSLVALRSATQIWRCFIAASGLLAGRLC